MTTAFLYYDLCRLRSVLMLVVTVVTGAVLLIPGPLQGDQPNWFQLIGILTGTLLAARLLSDTEGTQSYIYSRGATRRRIFVQRVLLGCGVILALGVWQWLLIVLGLRSSARVFLHAYDALYYPMSGRFEASFAKSFVQAAATSFGLMSFYMTWRGLCNPSWNSTSSGLARLALLEGPAAFVMLYMGLFSGGVIVFMGDTEDYSFLTNLLVWLPFGASILAVIVSWFASRNLEVA